MAAASAAVVTTALENVVHGEADSCFFGIVAALLSDAHQDEANAALRGRVCDATAEILCHIMGCKRVTVRLRRVWLLRLRLLIFFFLFLFNFFLPPPSLLLAACPPISACKPLNVTL